MDSRRCLTWRSIIAVTSASLRALRASTSFCLIAACKYRNDDNRSLSRARMAVLISFAIRSERESLIYLLQHKKDNRYSLGHRHRRKIDGPNSLMVHSGKNARNGPYWQCSSTQWSQHLT